MIGSPDVWGQRYRIEYRDNDRNTADDLDWYLWQDGMAEPVGQFRTREKAELFKRDRIAWEAKGSPPAERPAANAGRYR